MCVVFDKHADCGLKWLILSSTPSTIDTFVRIPDRILSVPAACLLWQYLHEERVLSLLIVASKDDPVRSLSQRCDCERITTAFRREARTTCRPILRRWSWLKAFSCFPAASLALPTSTALPASGRGSATTLVPDRVVSHTDNDAIAIIDASTVLMSHDRARRRISPRKTSKRFLARGG